MADRTFAPWVEPIAAQLRAGREQIVELAQAGAAEAWSKPSPNEGWTCKDLLAHLATGDWVCQTVLRAVVGDEAADLDVLGDLDAIGRGNARLLEERAARSVEDLIAEVREEGEESQALLARLTDAHEPLRRQGAPMSLGDYLRGFPDHDRRHTEQLRMTLEA